LRRQIKRDFRKPLICFTPKKLLRYPSCVSSIKEFTEEGFREVIDDVTADAKSIKKVVFCTGKIFYDLIETKTKESFNDIAIVRIEQLYPFPAKQISAILTKYKATTEFVWVQEEPENMGAWAYMFMAFRNAKLPDGKELKYVGRKAAASPATGYSKLHVEQEKSILSQVFTKQLVKSN